MENVTLMLEVVERLVEKGFNRQSTAPDGSVMLVRKVGKSAPNFVEVGIDATCNGVSLAEYLDSVE